MVGQEEYHAFHDTMIPNLSIQGNVCYFVLVCSPFDRKNGQKKNPDNIHDEIHCWLRFISSNTKRSLNSPPQVLVVLTNGDKGFQENKPCVHSFKTFETKVCCFCWFISNLSFDQCPLFLRNKSGGERGDAKLCINPQKGVTHISSMHECATWLV